jgi:acid phosphatase
MSFKTPWLLLLVTSFLTISVHAQNEKLIFAIDVIRHGDRTPTTALPNAPYAWPQGLGQLTLKGRQQEFELGSRWRQFYIQQQHLLPEHYARETLYVRSTDYDRTLMSAQYALLGLYPPDKRQAANPPAAYQAIPIHTVPLQYDELLYHDSKNKDYQQLIHDYVYARADWQKKTADLEPQFAHWSEVTGFKISGLTQLITLGDVLSIRQRYKIPLPRGLTATEAATIIAAGKWALVTLFGTAELGRNGQPLLQAISADLREAAHQKTERKLLIYSAHDSTLLILMNALHIPLNSPPPYASDLHFGLYKTAAGEYLVKVIFNRQTQIIPACGGPVCTVSEFEKLATSH